jgi:hypothetical protein
MADQQELTIVVDAINKASASLKQVEKDLDGLGKSIDKENSSAKGATAGTENMFGAFVKGGLVVKGIEMAFTFAKQALVALKDTMNDSVEVAAKYEAAMLGLASVSRSFGYDVDKTREAAERLSADGLLTPAQSAEALKNVLAGLSGATLEQGEAMILAMKDTASFNRVLYDYGDAIIQTTRGIRNRNSILTDSAGVQKNLSVVLSEAGFELQDLDSNSKKYAATQALINGYLEESKFAYGDASKYLETYLGKQTGLKAVLLDVKRLFGEGITPAFSAFTDVLKRSAHGLQSWLGENQSKIRALAITIGDELENVISGVSRFFERNKDIFVAVLNVVVGVGGQIVGELRKVWNFIQIVGNGFEFFVRTLVAGGKQMAQMLRGDFAGMTATGKDWLNKSAEIQQDFLGNLDDMMSAENQTRTAGKFNIATWWDSIQGIEKETRDEMLQDAIDSGEKISAEDIKTLQKLAKENEKYKREVEKRAKDFSESFDDLIIQHRDTIQQMTDDLKKEGIDYQKNVAEMLDSYNDSMDEMKKSHADKTKSIMADMEAETKKAKDEIEKLTEGYNEQVGLIQKEGESRVGDLQAQLAREKALGDKADTDKIAALEEMIAFEQAGMQSTVEEMQAKHDEEVADVNETLAEKLALLQTSLDEENAAYEEALAERKAQYEQDVVDAKASYEEKRAELQKELDVELAIREKYAEDFKRIGDRVALDDITRMVNKYNEEKAEAERQHQETLADLKGSSFAEGVETVNSFSAGVDSAYPALKEKTDQIKADIFSISDSINNLGGGNLGIGDMSGFGGGGGGGGGGGAWAQGGLASRPGIVGEAGPEIVLPLSFPKRMAQIMQSMGLSGSGGGGVTQTFYVTVNNPQDVDVLMERAGFAMKNQGGLT